VTVDDLSKGYVPVVIVAALMVGATGLGFRVGGVIEALSQKSSVLEARLVGIEREIIDLKNRFSAHEHETRSPQAK
jgi:hypothetical protein